EDELVQVLPVLEPLPELGGLPAQLVVGEFFELGLERGDVLGLAAQTLQTAPLAGAKDFFEGSEGGRHTGSRVARPRSPRDRRRGGGRGSRSPRAAPALGSSRIGARRRSRASAPPRGC